jgi:hypothetical protein
MQKRRDSLFDNVGRQIEIGGKNHKVLAYRQIGIKIVLLLAYPYAGLQGAPGTVAVGPEEAQTTAFPWSEAVDHADSGSLTGAVWTQQAEALARLYSEADSVYCD